MEAASAGAWEYQPGTGPSRGELGTAVGLVDLTFDDRERGAQTSSGLGWDQLTATGQSFYRALAKTDYTVPLVLGSKAMIPELWSAPEPMGQQVPGYLGMQNTDAINLYRRANRLDHSTAVVAYVGYQAPGMDLNVIDQDYSDAGGKSSPPTSRV